MSNDKQHSAEELDVHSHVPLIHKKQTINIKIMSKKTKHTAVEWQFEQLFNSFEKLNNGEYTFDEYLKRNLEIREQAKEMEKEQHKKTWFDSTSQFDLAAEMTFKKDFDEHYNKTYGDDKQ